MVYSMELATPTETEIQKMVTPIQMSKAPTLYLIIFLFAHSIAPFLAIFRDETVETASRASRSSRASSKRMTPVRTPPSPKEPSPSPRVLTESNTTRSKRLVTSHEDSLDGINEEDNDVVPSTSRAPLSSDSYYNRVSSPSSS